ncbi:MAG: hypothetical protein JSW54_07790 [Fidelibacterota bacterium]|nr:MAG: hypothetical protein JSW54_07790 [Candidatus Neomarinimicrobiota bacterium]
MRIRGIITGVIAILLMMAGVVRSEPPEPRGATDRRPGSLGFMMGLSLPQGSPAFNTDYILGASLMMVRSYDLADQLPGLRAELQLGVEVVAGTWGWGYGLSFPVMVNVGYDVVRLGNGSFRAGAFGGVGWSYHHLESGMEGVKVRDQHRPGIDMGLSAALRVFSRWELTLRAMYFRSFTSPLEAEYAGTLIRSRDRFGYGTLPVMFGVARRF